MSSNGAATSSAIIASTYGSSRLVSGGSAARARRPIQRVIPHARPRAKIEERREHGGAARRKEAVWKAGYSAAYSAAAASASSAAGVIFGECDFS